MLIEGNIRIARQLGASYAALASLENMLVEYRARAKS